MTARHPIAFLWPLLLAASGASCGSSPDARATDPAATTATSTLSQAALIPPPAAPPSLPGINPQLTVDVTAYGAAGDGATDDTAAIQAAVDDASAQGGGTVYFPPKGDGTQRVYIVNPTGARATQVWLKSNIRLLGAGGRLSVLRLPLGSQNSAMLAIGDPTYDATHMTQWQQNIEFESLGFDLVGAVARNAIRMYFPAVNVRIHDCEAFQSAIEVPGRLLNLSDLRNDNHFFNMDVTGFPVEGGAPQGQLDIPGQITVDHCTIHDLMQLTSDGGAGVRNLWLHDNTVYNALSFGIAVSSTGPENVLFDGLMIENNVFEAPVGAGIFVTENFVPSTVPFFDAKTGAALTVHTMRNVTIRNNTIHVRSTPAEGLQIDPQAKDAHGNPLTFAPTAEGIIVGNALLQTRNFMVTGNVLTCTNAPVIGTSREAFKVETWDFNWSQGWQQAHGEVPTIAVGGSDPAAGTFNTDGATITLNGHGLINGVQVQFKPLGATPLPTGLQPYFNYVVQRIDANTFSVTLPGSNGVLGFGAPPAGGRYQVILSPSLDAFTISGNTVSGENGAAQGDWDFDANVAGATTGLTVTNNAFSSRFVIAGSHDNLTFSRNASVGTVIVGDATLRRAVFGANTWSTPGVNVAFQRGIVNIVGPADSWRDVQATFADNTFSFVPPNPHGGPITAALWMNRGDMLWGGTGRLQVYGSTFSTPATLDWNVAPDYVVGWDGNPGTNVGGAIPTRRNCAVKDFDGDGNSDVVWSNPSSGDVYILLMNRGVPTTFAPVGTLPTGTSIVAVGDIDADGHSDLVVRNASTGEIGAFLMVGTAVESYVGLGSLDAAWTVAGLGNFASDSQTGLLLQNGSGALGFWSLTGTTVTGFTSMGSLPAPWTAGGTGDFDGDGTADVLLYDPTHASVAVGLVAGGAITSVQPMGTLPPPWQLVGVADFDDDGGPDMLWNDPSTGNLAIWRTNGTSGSSIGIVAAVPSPWHVID